MPKTFQRVTASSQEIASRFSPREEARALLANEADPEVAFEALVASGQRAEAARFLAHGLTKPEAVFWGSFCLRDTLPEKPPKEMTQAIRSAESWCLEPKESARWRAKDAADLAGTDTPAGLLALAAFMASGSLVKPDLPVAPPPPYLTADLAAVAIQIVAEVDPEKSEARWTAFLEQGRAVARGEYAKVPGTL